MSRLANAMADTGKEWADVVSQCNSGTYNNQYMIVDLKLFGPGQELQPNLLWVVEQVMIAHPANSQWRHVAAWTHDLHK